MHTVNEYPSLIHTESYFTTPYTLCICSIPLSLSSPLDELQALAATPSDVYCYVVDVIVVKRYDIWFVRRNDFMVHRSLR